MTKNLKANSTLLKVENLKKYFPIKKGIFSRHVGDVKAVDDISFSIQKGEIVGLVGGSGSGKTTAGQAAIRLIEPTSGSIEFLGQNFCQAPQKVLRSLRPKVQMVFQDPLASLNPRKTILENIGEPLLYHKKVHSKEELIEATKNLLRKIEMPLSCLNSYPHQFSGGQQQRISIGRAVILYPELIVCDEVVSALDLSIQAQILNLLYDLKKQLNLSYLFISHDLAVVRYLCDRLIVMSQGKIVEEGSVEAVFEDPQHPYTQSLIRSIPIKHPKQRII